LIRGDFSGCRCPVGSHASPSQQAEGYKEWGLGNLVVRLLHILRPPGRGIHLSGPKVGTRRVLGCKVGLARGIERRPRLVRRVLEGRLELRPERREPNGCRVARERVRQNSTWTSAVVRLNSMIRRTMSKNNITNYN
jgi:hypothetical protein